MAVDRTALADEARLLWLEDDSREHDTRLGSLDAGMKALASRVDIMGAKLGVYAALGACFGGGLVAGIITAVARAFFH